MWQRGMCRMVLPTASSPLHNGLITGINAGTEMKILLDQMHPFGSAYVALNDDGTVIMGSWSLNTKTFNSIHDALDYIYEEQEVSPDHMNIAKAEVLRKALNLPLH